MTTDALAELRAVRDDVHHLRRGRDEAQRQYAEALETLRPLADQAAEYKQRTAAAESLLRTLAVDAYREDRNRRPIAGVGIVMRTEYEYDERQALDWAMTHSMKSAVMLDRKGFERIVKATADDMQFVVVSQAPGATIATDLSAAIASETEGETQ